MRLLHRHIVRNTLQLAEVGHTPSIHVFCGQNTLAEGRSDDLADAEEKVAKAIETLELGDQAHGRYFPTHSPALDTALRTGVWFTRDSLKKWLGKMGMPQCTLSMCCS